LIFYYSHDPSRAGVVFHAGFDKKVTKVACTIAVFPAGCLFFGSAGTMRRFAHFTAPILTAGVRFCRVQSSGWIDVELFSVKGGSLYNMLC
jgi:hypothetical protein